MSAKFKKYEGIFYTTALKAGFAHDTPAFFRHDLAALAVRNAKKQTGERTRAAKKQCISSVKKTPILGKITIKEGVLHFELKS